MIQSPVSARSVRLRSLETKTRVETRFDFFEESCGRRGVRREGGERGERVFPFARFRREFRIAFQPVLQSRMFGRGQRPGGP